jgi:hypothetical protein
MATPDTKNTDHRMPPLNLVINVLSAPHDAFTELKQRPSKLFPLALTLTLNSIVLAWYFNMVDFAWYVDDSLSLANLEEDELETAKNAMTSMGRNTFLGFGILGSLAVILGIYTVNSGYLSLISALRGESLKFGHWFSLQCWAGMPIIVSIVGMFATLLLSPNGQLSGYDLDPFTLRNLGFVSDNQSVQGLYASLSLTMLWTVGLIIAGYKQWLGASWMRAILTVTAPYLLFLGVWSIFSFS